MYKACRRLLAESGLVCSPSASLARWVGTATRLPPRALLQSCGVRWGPMVHMPGHPLASCTLICSTAGCMQAAAAETLHELHSSRSWARDQVGVSKAMAHASRTALIQALDSIQSKVHGQLTSRSFSGSYPCRSSSKATSMPLRLIPSLHPVWTMRWSPSR